MDKREWNPGSLLKLSGSYWQTCVLHAAVKLDVFSAIGEERYTAAEIAKNLDADERAAAMLLTALVAMELLEKKDGTYQNTPAALRFLCKSSAEFMGYMILHHHQLMNSWSRLDEGVRTGKPVRDRGSGGDDTWRENFLMGMFNMAMQVAPKIVSSIDLYGRRHLLDLGGGPGTYSIHFCRQYPQLKATVYDLPTTRSFAEKTIEKFGMANRITFMDVDYLNESIEGTYDVAWLSHILHSESPQNCIRIINKAVSVLETGGLILVHDFILNNTMDGPLFPALFSLNMLLGTEAGQSYSEQQIMEMLAGAGVKNLKRIWIQTPNDSGIISGIVS
ncbi:MAG: methyltransferase domain-containing protein [Deltaproteobacteria bacterium]|nr:methyltransferase domain-containing protein [Deltaproteobacteria bacterium]